MHSIIDFLSRAGRTRAKCQAALRSGLAVFALTAALTPASAQMVSYYAGKDSAGGDAEIFTVPTGAGSSILSVEFSGKQHCDGVLTPGRELGGNTDGTELYPIIDGRATFSELRPDFFIAADIIFSGNGNGNGNGNGKVKGTLLFKQATYTGPNFPPKDRDAAACTTGKLTFTAKFVGTETLASHALAAHPRQ